MTKEDLECIIEKKGADVSALIGILQDIQKREYCIPVKTLAMVAERLNIPISRLYGLATFYKSFTLKPIGRHVIDVCLGTACHVAGGRRIMDRLLRDLHITEGGTTSDHRFTLNPVRCLGCCSISPVVRIDAKVYSRVTQNQLRKILEKQD